MNDIVIKAENISKQYRLGLVGSNTLSADIKKWIYKIKGKENPFLKIGEENDRSTKGNSEYVWALRDINFEVKKGEVLGFIGKNGAGKSTLLKLLSRVTTPTTGTIKYNGRMASLLEVGTGFHPELTGRENIFLNGAIMGMSKAEIKSKLDEIIAFSGVERYIDTPVKRYSSGMYVRLAFAVSAHLENEILVVDEVLAVGDAEFQKKCLGKMNQVSQSEGRTVIFVSHDMTAVSKLCDRVVMLEYGKSIYEGTAHDVINYYIKKSIYKDSQGVNVGFAIKDIYFENIGFNNSIEKEYALVQGDPLKFHFEIENKSNIEKRVYFNIEIKTISGIYVGCFGNEYQEFELIVKKEKLEINVDLGKCLWKAGEYAISYYFRVDDKDGFDNNFQEDNVLLVVKENPIKTPGWKNYINLPQHGSIPIEWKNIIVK